MTMPANPATATAPIKIPDPLAGQQTSTESALSTWAGPYVTDMLGKGQALSETPYQAYMGPLTAGSSQLQNQAFQGVAGLTLPSTMGGYTPGTFASPNAPPPNPNNVGIGSFMQDQINPNNVGIGRFEQDQFNPPGMVGIGRFEQDQQPEEFNWQQSRPPGMRPPMGTNYAPNNPNSTVQQYMNPYLQASLNPQLAEIRRQADISRMNDAARLTKAGAYGGSRQATMESEGNRNLATQLATTTGQGYNTAYDKAANQFNTEQALGLQAQGATNQYGLAALSKQAELGGVQRGIEGEGIAADYGQFKEERDFPYKQVQYQQSLLQGMPLATQSYNYQQPSTLANIGGTAGGIGAMYDQLFGPKAAVTPATTPPK